MADFDPTQFGAVAVEEPPQQEAFDPTAHGAIPVQGEERSIPSKIGHAVLDTLKGFIPQSVEDAALAPVTMFPGVGQAYKSLSNIVSGRPAAEGISPLAGIPVVQRIPEIIQAEKTPALSQERFTTGVGVVADLGMIAGFKGMLHPEVIAAKPKLAEVAGFKAPETPMAAAVEPVPGVSPTTETVTQPGQFTTPVESTADQAARNLEGQFADLNTQAADLQARINAQRGTPLGKVEPVAPNLPTETGEVQPVTITGFHGTRTDVSNASQFGGVHIGSEIAANQRLENTPSQRVGGVPGAEKVQQVETTLRKPYGTPENPISETELSTIVNLPGKLQELKSRGYDGIIYRNIVEDAGNISALTFDPKQVRKVSDMRIGGTTGPMLVRKNATVAPVSTTAPLSTETGEPNASKITSTTSVTQPEVRTQVGERASLRQQGETPEARQGTEEKYTPEQTQALAEAEDRRQSGLQNADNWEARGDPENAQKMRKAAGMRYAAEVRQITGNLTVKEAAAVAKKEASNYIGKDVIADGRPAKVVSNPFGKVRVQFEDGTKQSFDVERIKPVPKPQPAPQAEVAARKTAIQSELGAPKPLSDLVDFLDSKFPRIMGTIKSFRVVSATEMPESRFGGHVPAAIKINADGTVEVLVNESKISSPLTLAEDVGHELAHVTEYRRQTPQSSETLRAINDVQGGDYEAYKNDPKEIRARQIGTQIRDRYWQHLVEKEKVSPQAEVAAPTQTETAPPTEPPTPPVTEQGASDETHISSIANKFTEERTKSGELGEIAPGQGYSTKEMAAQGLKMSPEQINQHVSDLMNNTGNPIEQGKAVRAEEARLSQRSAELSRAASADPTNVQARVDADNAFKDVTDFHNGPIAKLKTIFHATGVGLQGELPLDLSTFNGLREAFLKDTGKAPTPEQEPQLRQMAKKVSKSVVEDNGAKQKLGQEIEKVTSKRKLPTYDEVRNNITERMKTNPCRV